MSFPSGIKLLYDSENSVVDIIFVHGLTGDREKTWKAKNTTAPWPQTLLPSKVPNSRVLTFGYDAYVADWRGVVSKNRIGNHSMNLLAAIATYREDDDTNNRPIIFVCHSLGGLVCEDALVAARQRPERHLQNVLHSTRGIIFLGTPHHGAALAKWAETLARSIGLLKQTNPQILGVLESDSEVLARIQDSFHTMIRSRNRHGSQSIEITCFYEELPLPGFGIVVPSQSAILPGYIPIGIRSNHMDMTKFKNGDDPGFTAVAGELRRWVKELITPSNAEVAGVDALKRQQADQQQGRTFLVPYTSNPGFVGRSDILEELKKRLASNLKSNGATAQARAALFGLGGIGKTQIALAYAHWIYVKFPEASVFWVHASNAERFHQAFSQIAQSCRIPGCSDPKANVLKLVKDWLEREDQRPWLMIIDNADDTDMFFSSSETAPQQLEDSNRLSFEGTLGRYIPECSHGAILITTRNKQTGSKLTRGRGMIEVKQMNQAESSQLIHKRLESDSLNQDHISLLTDRLENIPLAVVQATAFIQMNSMTVARYLELLDQSHDTLVELLSQPFEAEGRDSSIPNAVTATWIISFQKLREQSPYASDLLSLVSFFDRQGIPKRFLSHYVEQRPSQESGQQEQENRANRLLELEKALGILKAFSFVLEGKDDGDLNMHRLIPLVMRKWLKTEGNFGEWAGKALLIVSDLYPYGKHENRKICGEYLPHAFAVLSYEGSSSTTEALAKARLLHNTAGFMDILGQWNKAEEFLLPAVETRKRVLGSEHRDTLDSISELAGIYHVQGRWEEAEDLQVQVLETTKKMWGDEHSNTLICMNNLTATYRDQGRWKEAEDLQVQLLKTSKKILGDEHSNTLIYMNNLTVTYSAQGRWKEAEDLQVQLLKTSKTVLRDEHPDTLIRINNLTLTYSAQGRWKKAENLQVQLLKTSKTVLGDEHPDTLRNMNNLAVTYSAQGRWKEAEDLQVQLLKTSKTVLGDEHPNTLIRINNLALTYRDQGRWKEAEDLQVQLLKTSKTVLGDEHPDTLIRINNLALTYSDQGRWKKAEDLQIQLLKTSKTVLRDEHPDTLIRINNLALTYSAQGRWKEAEDLQVQLLKTSKTVLGDEHPNTLIRINNLALTYRDQGRWKKAEDLQVQLLKTSKTVLGDEHPDTLRNMNNLALTYRDQGRWKEAEDLQVQVLETTKKMWGDEHPDTLRNMNNLAGTWKDQNRNDEAIKLMAECVQMRKKIIGVNHPDTKVSTRCLDRWQKEKDSEVLSEETLSNSRRRGKFSTKIVKPIVRRYRAITRHE